MYKAKKKKILSLILICAFMFNIFTPLAETIVKAAVDEIDFKLEQIVDKSEAFTGKEFTYTLKYANPNTTTDAYNVVITDKLPDNIRYVSSITSQHVESTKVQNIDGHDVVIFKFKERLNAGSTGFVKITAKFPPGTTFEEVDGNPNRAENTASIKGDNGIEVFSNKVVVTPKLKKSDWSITKTKINPSSTPALGYPVTYAVKVKGNSSIGGLDLHNVRVVDTLPAGAEYLSSSGGGNYDDGKVTWNIGDVKVGGSARRTVTVKYPSDKFTTSSSVTNIADGYAALIGTTDELTKQVEITHGFAAPIIDVSSFTKSGRQSNDRYSEGQTAVFKISNIQNTGNIPLDKILIEDFIPLNITTSAAITVTTPSAIMVTTPTAITITTGSYSDNVTLNIKYKTNKKDWRDWLGGIFNSPNNESLNSDKLSLDSDEHITNVKWELNNGSDGIPAGFKNTSPIEIRGTVYMPSTGNKITNTANLTALRGGDTPIVKSDSKDIYVVDSMPWLVPKKTVENRQTKFDMNDTVEYKLRIKNHEYATGNYENPTAIDVLPVEMEDVQIIGWDKGNSNITQDPTINTSVTKNIDGKNHQILKWNFTGILKPGQYVDVKYSAKIKDKTLAGNVTNTFYITSNQDQYENASDIILDTDDLDGNGKTDDKLVKDSVDIFVKFVGGIESEQWIKGELDTQWGYYGGVNNGKGKTLPGGIVDYKLKVKNTDSNGPIKNIVLIDIFPYIGDMGVIDTKARESKWRPYLVNKITGENGTALPPEIKVYYSTNPNPSKQELDDPINNKGLSSDKWSETPPDDITSVRALKIDFTTLVLQANEQVMLQWSMRAPFEAPREKIAWNSFGYVATYPDVGGQEPFLPSEPKKVGFEVQNDPNEKYYIGDFVWHDLNKNGIQDSGESGINGILVNLYKKGEAVPFKYTRTGESYIEKSGYYEFPNLVSGNYIVEFVFPKEYRVSPYKVGSNRDEDSDIQWSSKTSYTDNGTEKFAIKTEEIVITDSSNFSIDAGLYMLASIGDKVWNDKDADGKWDSGEPGIQGVKVTLLDNEGNRAKYKDGTVEVPTATTDANGNYKFEKLEPGKYKVEFENPNGYYKFTSFNIGSDDSKDSDASIIEPDGSKGTTESVVLESNGDNLTVDAGMYLAQIGNYVWEDKNADGIQNDGATGIRNVEVTLYKGDGTTFVKSTKTNSSGYYLFDELLPDDYIVQFTKPSGFDKFSKDAQGSDIAKDSDAKINNGKTSKIILSAGERDLTIDAGLYMPASIGNYLWEDINGDGIQNDGESGINGVKVYLYKVGTDTPIANTTTANEGGKSGYYKFQNLVPGDYYLKFDLPSGFDTFTLKKQGSNDTLNSDVDQTTYKTPVESLTSGENNMSYDAGVYKYCSIGDRVWEDKDRDGIQDGGEPGIKGIVVNLYKKGVSTVFKTTTTDDNSKYEFIDIIPGEYEIEFKAPYYYTITANDASLDFEDSDINAEGKILDIVVESGKDNLTLDAGYVLPNAAITVEKTVYAGHDGGTSVGGELVTGIKGTPITYVFTVTNTGDIHLKDISLTDVTVGIDKSDMTYVSGEETLAPGGTLVYYYETTINGDLTNTVEVEGTPSDKDGNLVPNVSKPSDDDTAEVNEVKPEIKIEKTVYAGHDGGNLVGGELVTGINGTPITYVFTVKNTGDTYLRDISLKDENLGIDKSKMTKVRGNELLAPGGTLVYYYETIIDGNLTNTAETEGIPSHSDGNVITNVSNPSDKDTAEVKLPASLGDYVWNDANTNGKQDANEKGISKVKVILTDANQKSTTVLTDADGKYIFDNLMPGSYTVKIDEITLPSSMRKSYELDITLDNKVNVTLSSGQFKDDVDFGYYRYVPSSSSSSSKDDIVELCSVGTDVWNDENGNGKQDKGEKGIPDVTVILADRKGRTSTIITNRNGKYIFRNLIPGKYIISVDEDTLPEEFKETYELDNTLDNEVSIRLSGKQCKTDVDFGYNKDIVNVGEDEKTQEDSDSQSNEKNEDSKSQSSEKDEDSDSQSNEQNEDSKSQSNEKDEESKKHSNEQNTDSHSQSNEKNSESNSESKEKNTESSSQSNKKNNESSSESNKKNEQSKIHVDDRNSDSSTNNNLPKTGTEYFNLLLLGILIFTANILFIVRRRRKEKARRN